MYNFKVYYYTRLKGNIIDQQIFSLFKIIVNILRVLVNNRKLLCVVFYTIKATFLYLKKPKRPESLNFHKFSHPRNDCETHFRHDVNFVINIIEILLNHVSNVHSLSFPNIQGIIYFHRLMIDTPN